MCVCRLFAHCLFQPREYLRELIEYGAGLFSFRATSCDGCWVFMRVLCVLARLCIREVIVRSRGLCVCDDIVCS